MDDILKRQCNQHIQYIKCLTTKGNGDKTFADPVDVQCMVTGSQSIYIGDNGEEYKSKYTIYIDEKCPIMDMKDLIIVSGTRRMPIRDFRPYYDDKGLFYGAVLLV